MGALGQSCVLRPDSTMPISQLTTDCPSRHHTLSETFKGQDGDSFIIVFINSVLHTE